MKFYKKASVVAAIVAAVSFGVVFVQTASAATTTVAVGSGGNHFVPASVTISPNDSVVWTWSTGFHSSTSGTNGVHGDDNGVPSGSWDSGVIQTLPFSYTNTFTSAGAFKYYCTVHFSVGMTGQVLVAAASL
ncbi:MAG TPA: plastocyanin/azurin family copper-binding protein, partial [Pseudomonadales bacterium]|nr:plastocyanin/azurin family copper-binding protein [Pseudomonadales bacterium]